MLNIPDHNSTGAPEHYHGLDFIRAAMMMLVVVLHSSVSFIPNSPDALWPYRDPQSTMFAPLIAIPIHIFCMVTFFVMAGFFSALLYQHRGAWGLIANRARSIALPLVVGWVVMFPLESASFVMGAMRSPIIAGQPTPSQMATTFLENPWANPTPNYFWFLYYLLFFYLIALVFIGFSKVVPRKICASADSLAQTFLCGRLRILLIPTLAALTWWSMLTMSTPGIDTPDMTFMPREIVLVSYGIYFFFGWILYRHKEFIQTLKPRAGTRFCCGVVCLIVAVGLELKWQLQLRDGQDMASDSMRTLFVMTQGAIALTTWPLILGGIGLAERWLQQTNTVVKYFVDRAFWMYLTHLPVCLLIIVLMRDWNAPGYLKMFSAIALTFAVVLLAFEAVRAVLPKQKVQSAT